MLWTPPQSREIGECIYCGNADVPLQREHAIPYGLNGEWTLLQASCEKCASITHRFERDTLRGLLPSIRNILAMQSRRRKQRIQMLPIILGSGTDVRIIDLPSAEYPLYLPTPQLPPPGVIANRERSAEMLAGVDLIHIAGPTFEQVAHRYGVDSAMARLSFAPTEFARTIAKIGYSAAVCSLGIEPFRRSEIRQVILGVDPYVGYWVGSSQQEMNPTTGLHAIRVCAGRTDVHAFVQLFAQFGAPEYHVVLGPADPAFVNSEAWPWR